MDQAVGITRRGLTVFGVAAAVMLLTALSLVTVRPMQSGATTFIPHIGSTCTQTGEFPYGSAVVGIAATQDDGGYWPLGEPVQAPCSRRGP